MAVTPRIHEVAAEEVRSIAERYPGYRDALVDALDQVVVHQSQAHQSQRRDDVTKVVEALGKAANAKGGAS